MNERVLVRAPANIAIVKYMGKTDARVNLPANASLSMTLNTLCSVVELRPALASRWIFEKPEVSMPGMRVPELDAAGIQKFEKHLGRVLDLAPAALQEFGLATAEERSFEIRSANTFPAASGIASSASSFAALTLAGAAALAVDRSEFQEKWVSSPGLRRALARISRQGSGSSCRSFEGPWVAWEGENAAVVPSSIGTYVDLVMLVASGRKEVSSSNAHAAVTASPLWMGRPDRADQRVQNLKAALARGDHSTLAQVAWQELWEMHSLFHTSPQPFTYWLPLSLEILKWLKPWVDEGFSQAPVVTMDAGPNVHLLVPDSRADEWKARIAERFPGLEVLVDQAGVGATFL